MSKASLPKLSSLCILAAVVGKLQVLIDESLSKNYWEYWKLQGVHRMQILHLQTELK